MCVLPANRTWVPGSIFGDSECCGLSGMPTGPMTMPTDPWEAWEPGPCHLLHEENARYGWDEMHSGPQCPLLGPEDHWEERPSLATWQTLQPGPGKQWACRSLTA